MMNEAQIDDIIRRWRDTPQAELQRGDYEQFKDFGSACLNQGESQQLLKFVQDEKNKDIVKSMGCVLLAPLLNELLQKGKNHDHCQATMTHLTATCCPDEVLHCLVDLIKDISPCTVSDTILTLLPHLQTVLLRVDEGRGASLGLVLSAVQKQLCVLPVPYTKQQEEADEFGLCRCCTALTALTNPFIQELKSHNGGCATTAAQEEMKTELLKFCLRGLRDPLLEAELNRDRKSVLWLFATEIMVTLPAIQESVSDILFYSSVKKSPLMDSSQSKESIACLAYLLFVQLISMESFPAVFSPVFVLQCNMEYINELLSSKKESRLLKGLALYSKSLESVQDNSLPVSLLELKSFYSVPQNLRRVLTDCPMQNLRESGLQVLQLFINKLDAEAKHKFFRCMLKTSNHPGLEAYIVKNIRNEVEVSLKVGSADGWFMGVEFLSLLRLVLHLPQGTETDLLHNMDRIMECLNLLRYLLIRDKDMRGNANVWEEVCRLKDEYVKKLRVCISLSRAYYSSELKALQEDQKLKVKEARASVRAGRSFKTVNQQRVSDMSPQERLQVLQSALVTFDLMESLVVRIEEITEEKLKIPN